MMQSLTRMYAIAFLYKVLLVVFCFSLVGFRCLLGVTWFDPGATKGQIENLLATGANVDMYSVDGHTGLSYAAMTGNSFLAKALLDKGALIYLVSQETKNPKEQTRNTPLHWAVGNAEVTGTPEVQKMFLYNYADTIARNFEGKTPAHYVFFLTRDTIRNEALRQLVLFGADLNLPDNKGNTVAHIVASTGARQWVTQSFLPLFGDLIDYSLKNMQSATNNAATPRDYAYQLGFRDFAQAWDAAVKPRTGKDLKANQFNKLGLSGLMVAALWDDVITANALLERGEKINAPAKHEYGDTALSYAIMRGNVAMIKLLLSKGASLTQVNTMGLIPFHMLMRTPAANLPLVIQALKPKLTSALINTPDAQGNTLMHQAVMLGQPALVQTLLAQFNLDPLSNLRFNLGAKNKKGETPIDLAKKPNRAAIASVFASLKPNQMASLTLGERRKQQRLAYLEKKRMVI